MLLDWRLKCSTMILSMLHTEYSFGPSQDTRMGSVINRLSLLTEPNKIIRLTHAIDTYKNQWLTSREQAEVIFSSLQGRFIDKQKQGKMDEATKESYQAALAGYLFAENKRSFEQQNAGTGYSSEKEGRQIKAVALAIDKQHLHMGTGEGKSSVVIPISAIVEAATNGQGKVVVGSANGLLVEELTQNIKKYTEMVSNLACNKNVTINTQRISSENEQRGERTVKQLMRDSLLENESGIQAKNQQFDSFWNSIIETTNERKEEKYYETSKDYHHGDISVYVGEERNIVFDWMGNRKIFEKGCPTILMDEAHVAFDRGSPYSQTSGSEALSNETIQSGISEYLANYIVAQRLKLGLKGGLIKPSKGGYELSDQGVLKAQLTNISNITIEGKDEDSLSFMDGVDIVLKNIGHVPPKRRVQIAEDLLANLKQFIPERTNPLEKDEIGTNQFAYFESIGNEIAKMLPNKEKMFTTNRRGKNQLRDAYIDQLLSNNKYNPTTQMAVLAIAGKFEPIERSISYKNSTYASFVYGVQDKLVAFSGTLMTPDPLKRRMKRGAFAAFLESTTKRNVHMLASPEIKLFPKPRLLDDTEGLYNLLVNNLTQEQMRPTLIVDNGSLDSAKETYAKIVEKFGKQRVRLLTSKPAEGDEKEERKYERDLDRFRKQLAEGEIDILISSGSAALGTNFVKKDAHFPDLRTITIGMPESEEKMAQTIGRRRLLEGETQNHFWYLTQADIEPYITYFKDEKDKSFYDLKKGKGEITDDIQRAKNDPDKLFKIMVEFWDKARAARAVDTDFAVGYDILMNQEVIPTVERYMKTQIALKILGFTEQELTLIYKQEEKTQRDGQRHEMVSEEIEAEERKAWDFRKKRKLIDWTYQQMGTPSTLYSDIQQAYSLLPPVPKSSTNAISTAAINRLLEMKKYIFANPEGKATNEIGFGLSAYLDSWFESGKESVSGYINTTQIKENMDTIVPEKNTDISFVDLRLFGVPPGVTMKLVKKLNVTRWKENEYDVHIVELSHDGETQKIPILYNEALQRPLILFDPTLNEHIYFKEEEIERIQEIQIQAPPVPIQYRTRLENGQPGDVVNVFALKIRLSPPL